MNPKRLLLIIITGIIVICILCLLAYMGYSYDWTGFSSHIEIVNGQPQYRPAKTFWDWMQLLIIPLILAGGAIWFNFATNRNERKIAFDRQREELLQAYLGQMSKLLLENDLRKSDLRADARYIARALTLTALPQLDANRKGRLIQFLHESGLISGNESNCIISLNDADLSEANLSHLDLFDVNLSETNLRRANLRGAYLYAAKLDGTVLSDADLSQANLTKASINRTILNRPYIHNKRDSTISFTRIPDLSRANLSGTILKGADLCKANLKKANLKGAKLKGTVLWGANLTGANLSKITIDEKTCLFEADLSNTKQNGTDLTKANRTHPPENDESE